MPSPTVAPKTMTRVQLFRFFARLFDFAVKIHSGPTVIEAGLSLGKVCTHGEIGLGEIQIKIEIFLVL